MTRLAASGSLLDLAEGFLALPRRLLRSPFFQSLRPDERFLVVTMLAAARYAEGGEFWFAGTRIALTPGQFIDSEETIATAAGTTRKVTRTVLRKCVTAGLLTRSRVHPAGQCPTVTTVVDYERIRYAGADAGPRTGQGTGQAGASGGPADGPADGPHQNKENHGNPVEPGEPGQPGACAEPLALASPQQPSTRSRKGKKPKQGDGSVEPLRLRLLEAIRATGVTYVDTSSAAERTQLRRALKAGTTEAEIESAFRAVYARGGWNPRIQDVARVVTAAGEKRNASPSAAPVPAAAAGEFTGRAGGFR